MTPILGIALLLALAIVVAVGCSWIGRGQELAANLKDAKRVFDDRPEFHGAKHGVNQKREISARPVSPSQRKHWLVELATEIDEDEIFVDNLINDARRRRGEIVVGVGKFS